MNEGMSAEKQKMLINFLLSSAEVCDLCFPIIEPGYFSPEYRNAVQFIKDYYRDHKVLPTPEMVHAEAAGGPYASSSLTDDQVTYCCDEIEEECRRQAVMKAILRSPEHWRKGDYKTIEHEIKKAIRTSIQRPTAPKPKLTDDLDAKGSRYVDTMMQRLGKQRKVN